MTDEPLTEPLLTQVLNQLCFRTLNVVPYEPSESVAEAIDGLAEWIRRGSLGITLALLEIAHTKENHPA